MEKSFLIRGITYCVVFSIFLLSGCKGKEEKIFEKISTEEPRKTQLIWQKKFNASVISFKMRKLIKEKEFPLLAVKTANELIVFDRYGKEYLRRKIPVLTSKETGKTYKGFLEISDNGKYILEGWGFPQFSSHLRYTTVEGGILWKVQNFHGLPLISPDGEVVVLLETNSEENKKGVIKFMSSSGKLLNKHLIDLSSIEMPLYAFSFSEDSKYFALRIEEWIDDKKGRRAIYPVLFFDKKGVLLWKRYVEVSQGKTPIFELLVSPHGNYISFTSEKKTYLVDKKGRLIREDEFFNLFSYSANEKLLIAGKDKAEIYVINVVSGRRLFSIDYGYPLISPDGRVLFIVRTIQNTNGKQTTLSLVDLTNKKEKLILRRNYLPSSQRKYQFSSDGKYLYFVEQNNKTLLSVYRVLLVI